MNSGLTGKTPVMVLQEIMVKLNKGVDYIEQPSETDPCSNTTTFYYKVTADGESVIGQGRSKKMAKQEAARKMLEKLDKKRNREGYDVTDFSRIEQRENVPFEERFTTNYVGELQEYCMNKALKIPVYRVSRDEGPPHSKLYFLECTIGDMTEEGSGLTKKDAKQKAAQLMLQKLKGSDSHELGLLRPTTTGQEFDDLKRKVLERLVETGVRKIKIPDNDTSSISNYFKLISDFPKSAILNLMKDEPRTFFEKLPSPGSKLKSILNEWKITESHGCMPVADPGQCGVWLTVESSPPWTFFGYGTDEDKALVAAYVDALFFFAEMSR